MNTLTGRRFLAVDRSTFLLPFQSFCIIGDWSPIPEEFLENGIPGNFPGRGPLGELTYNPTFQALVRKSSQT
jgi:hypothetical protein